MRELRWQLCRAVSGLSIAALLLSGCASFSPFSSPADRLGAAVDKQQYQRALAIIDDTSENHPQYGLLNEQRHGVLQASQEYRKEKLLRARQLAARKHWHEAGMLLEETRDRVADPSPVEAALQQVRERQEETLRTLLTQWYLAQAQALLNTETLDQQLQHHSDSRAAQIRAQQAQLREQTSDGLTEIGSLYADQGRWHQALTCLEMAQRLTPEQTPPNALKRARKTLSNAQAKAQDARQETRHQQAAALVARYQAGRRLEDLLAARTYLAQHGDADLDGMRKQVERWSSERFRRSLAKGEALYAQGDYRAAHQLWQQVAPLAPENSELQEKLERSERVIKNLESLNSP